MRLADDLPPLQCRNVKKIRGLNLPGTPWATSALRGRPLLYLLQMVIINYYSLRKIPLLLKSTNLLVTTRVVITYLLHAVE